MVYCIKKGYEEKFHKLRKRRLELYKLVDQNNKKRLVRKIHIIIIQMMNLMKK